MQTGTRISNQVLCDAQMVFCFVFVVFPSNTSCSQVTRWKGFFRLRERNICEAV